MLCDETGWYALIQLASGKAKTDTLMLLLLQCDILESTFHLEFDQVLPISNSIRWITAYEKLPAPTSGSASEKTFTSEKTVVKSRKALVSFVPPSAGMFVWLAVHLENHPDYKKLKAQGEDASRVLIEKLWIQLAENNVSFLCLKVLFPVLIASFSVTRYSSPPDSSSKVKREWSTKAPKTSASIASLSPTHQRRKWRSPSKPSTTLLCSFSRSRGGECESVDQLGY